LLYTFWLLLGFRLLPVVQLNPYLRLNPLRRATVSREEPRTWGEREGQGHFFSLGFEGVLIRGFAIDTDKMALRFRSKPAALPKEADMV
jgi:hypothetical protein